jgi:hypothetical protein
MNVRYDFKAFNLSSEKVRHKEKLVKAVLKDGERIFKK